MSSKRFLVAILMLGLLLGFLVGASSSPAVADALPVLLGLTTGLVGSAGIMKTDPATLRRIGSITIVFVLALSLGLGGGITARLSGLACWIAGDCKRINVPETASLSERIAYAEIARMSDALGIVLKEPLFVRETSTEILAVVSTLAETRKRLLVIGQAAKSQTNQPNNTLGAKLNLIAYEIRLLEELRSLSKGGQETAMLLNAIEFIEVMSAGKGNSNFERVMTLLDGNPSVDKKAMLRLQVDEKGAQENLIDLWALSDPVRLAQHMRNRIGILADAVSGLPSSVAASRTSRKFLESGDDQ